MRTEDEEATWQALNQIARDGSDLTRPLTMDFFLAVPDRLAGEKVAALVAPLGFDVSVEQDSETGEWTCYASQEMVPTYESVREAEKRLDLIARSEGGTVDGFGTFGNS